LDWLTLHGGHFSNFGKLQRVFLKLASTAFVAMILTHAKKGQIYNGIRALPGAGVFAAHFWLSGAEKLNFASLHGSLFSVSSLYCGRENSWPQFFLSEIKMVDFLLKNRQVS